MATAFHLHTVTGQIPLSQVCNRLLLIHKWHLPVAGFSL